MSDLSVEEKPDSQPTENRATGKKRADGIAGLVLLAFSAYVIIESLSMDLSSEYGPGPGFFPLGLGIILAVLSFLLIVENLNPRKKDKASPFKKKKGIYSAGLALLGLIGYALLIKVLGYLITTFLLVIFLMGVVARDKVRTTLLTAIGVTLLLFLIFQVGLNVHLPKGPFGF
jgi:putative tricarboxylic transport membrane protein